MNDDDYNTKQQRTKKDSDSEQEEDSPQVHLLNQQHINLQPENSTQEPSQDTNTQQGDNKIYLGKEFGYLPTDYYNKDASPSFGEWAKNITPSSLHLAADMGVSWQYLAEKHSEQKATTQPSPEITQSPQISEQPQQTNNQQQDWANLSLQERLEAIRSQYGISQSNSNEKQQQHFRDRSR